MATCFKGLFSVTIKKLFKGFCKSERKKINPASQMQRHQHCECERWWDQRTTGWEYWWRGQASSRICRIYFWALLWCFFGSYPTLRQCHSRSQIFTAPRRFFECRSWYHLNCSFSREKVLLTFWAFWGAEGAQKAKSPLFLRKQTFKKWHPLYRHWQKSARSQWISGTSHDIVKVWFPSRVFKNKACLRGLPPNLRLTRDLNLAI